jgi:hypothetical protein
MNTNKDLNAWDTFMNAMGIGVSRYSPLTEVYDMVDKWKKKQGIVEPQAVYPPSKFRDLRNAVQDDAEGKVKSEWAKLLKENPKMKPQVLASHFRQSLFRPFTGSHKNDLLFRKELNDLQKEKFDTARKDRQRLYMKFRQIMAKNRIANTAPEPPTDTTTEPERGEE